MNWQVILSAIMGIVELAPKIKAIWDGSGGFAKILALFTSPQLQGLAQLGAQLFPDASKSVQQVLAAIHLGYPDSTKWVQQALNAGQTLGYIHFGDPLVVDGKFGPKTMAAVVALQNKLGIHANGAVTEVEYAALNLLLAGKTP